MRDVRCDDCRALLDAYVDGELPESEASEVRAHLESCATCAAEHQMLIETSSRVRGTLARPPVPDVLRARIRGALADADTDIPIAPPARLSRSTWRLAAAGLIIAAVGVGAGAWLATANARRTPVTNEVLSSHLRSLMPGHLTDVASTDQHNVKPWFNGRAAFSPAVPRLDSAGFPLVGGRLDYVGDRQVAAVVYGRRQHMINVFAWPAAGEAASAPSFSTERGYHLVKWIQGGVEYWAASDLSVGDLTTFVALFRQESAK